MTNGEKVIKTAQKYLGVRETSENSGPFIDGWQKRWDMGRGTNIGPQPWCGMFADAMFAEAGVDDAHICHPSTGEMARRARAGGYVWNGRGKVPTGALWINEGIHTCIVVKDYDNGWLLCIDGNSSDRVQYTRRPRRGNNLLIAVPPSIAKEPDPVFVTKYFIDDLKAEPYVYRLENGKVPRWKLKKNAERTVVNMLNARPPVWDARHPRVVRLGNGTWGIQLGDVRTRKFTTKAKQLKSYKVLMKRFNNPEGRFRRYNKKYRVN